MECPICFDAITTINNCTTPCGHSFCFNCIAKNLSTNNCCPYCRTELVEKVDSEDEYEDTDDENSEADEEDLEDEEDIPEADIETIAQRLQDKQYTYIDLLALIIGRSGNIEKHSNEFFHQLSEDLDNIMDEADMEAEECAMFAQEDKDAGKNANNDQEEIIINEAAKLLCNLNKISEGIEDIKKDCNI